MPAETQPPVWAALQRVVARLPADRAQDTPDEADVRLLTDFVQGAAEVLPTIRKMVAPLTALLEAPDADA